jgi:antitoxin component of MazEF toxin-antitoxin module
MTTRISKWGNGFGVRIPKQFMVEMGLMANSEVRLEFSGTSITIEPVEVSRKRRARRPLSYYLDRSRPTTRDHEIATGPARGREDFD